MVKKRGEITTGTVITIIILVIGFALLLFLYYQFNWTGRINKDACHQSVIFRSTLPTTLNANELIPLKCKTDKMCITSSMFGKCDDFKNVQGVTTVQVKDIHEIEKIIAQNIVDCWSMMGEGKVSVFSQYFPETYGFGTTYSSCVLCTRVAFDVKSLADAKIDLNNLKVDEYMETRQMPGQTISYKQFLQKESGLFSVKGNLNLIDGSSQGVSVAPSTDEIIKKAADTAAQAAGGGTADKPSDKYIVEKASNGYIVKEKATDKTISSISLEGNDIVVKDDSGKEISRTTIPNSNSLTNKDAQGQPINQQVAGKELGVLFMQINAPQHGVPEKNVAIAMGLLEATTGIFTANIPLTNTNLLGIAVNLCKSAVQDPLSWKKWLACIGPYAALVVTQEAFITTSQIKAYGRCGDLSLGDKAYFGCSVIRTFPYTEDDINNYCDAIESIP